MTTPDLQVHTTIDLLGKDLDGEIPCGNGNVSHLAAEKLLKR